MNKNATVDDIKGAARGNWPSVLRAAGVPENLLDTRKHQPCPACGGTDRYRFTDYKGEGVWICNQCRPESGSPFDLLMLLFGYSFVEAKDILAGILGLGGSDTERREIKQLPPPEKKPSENSEWVPVVPVPDFALASMNFRHGWRSEGPVSVSVFKNADGAVLGAVVRFRKSTGGKVDLPYTFCRNTQTGIQEWRWKVWDSPRPLYGLDALASQPNDCVLVVEGEKCKNAADAARLGYVVVTWHGGVNNWDKSDWTPLAGRKVILWPDADSQRVRLTPSERDAGIEPESKPYLPRNEQPGMKAMLGIAKILEDQGCIVGILNIPQPGIWPCGYDIADALEDGGRFVDPHEVLAWQNLPDWVSEYSSEASSAPSLSGVPDSVDYNSAEPDSGTLPQGGAGDDAVDENFRRLLSEFALIEGKTKAINKKTAIEYSRQGMIAQFGKASVDKWFESVRKSVWPQSEVNRAKRDRERYEAERADGVPEMLDRYIYLDGSSMVWDKHLRKMLDQGALKMALADTFKIWANSPARRVVRFDRVVFAPGRELGDDYINLYEGLPFEGKEQIRRLPEGEAYDFRKFLQLYPETYPIQKLIFHLCNDDWQYVEHTLNWLAYPLQHIGTKMATAMVFHGDTHGAGKTLLFEEIIKPIYGDCGGTFGQSDLESQYTGNRQGKLFVLFEEIFNNKQKYDHSGAMKHMITGKTMRIERKFIESYEEENHMNCVFLSNEVQPFKIEENDRRYFVIWPNSTTPENLKKEIIECIGNGGVEMFYSLLMAMPLLISFERDFSDPELPFGKPVKMREPLRFDSHTKPPMTAAKQNVIALGRYSWQSFFSMWSAGEIPDLPFGCCATEDLCRAYNAWCSRTRETAISDIKFISNVATRMIKSRKRCRWPESNRPDEVRQFMVFKPKDFVVPDGVAEMDIIGKQVYKFKEGLNAFLGFAEN